MAAPQKVAIQETLDCSAVSPGFGSATSGYLQQPLKDNSENLRRDIKYHNEKAQAFNRQDHCNRPEKRIIGKNRACPRIASNQRSQSCISSEEEKLKHSASAQNVSLLHFLHSLQEKSLCSGNPEGRKDQSSGMHNMVKRNSPEHAGTHQQQIDSDIVDNVIGDELDVKASSGHHFDATESTALEKQCPSVLQDSQKLPDAATGRISCASHSSPGRSQSEHCRTKSHNETMSQLQPVSYSEGLKQLINTQIESAVSRLSSSSSSSSSSCSSLVERRTLESEQITHGADPSKPCRHSIPQANTNMPNNAEATEVNITQNSHVALLRTLLAEKDKDLNQLSKELKKLQLINNQLLEEQCLIMSANKKLQKETNKALEDKVKGDESEADYFAYNPTAPAVLQQRIEDLKSHLKDLQEANDSAVNELTKADEEISQLRGEIAKLRTKHAEELQDAKQESVYFKDKINRLHCDPARHTLEDNTFDFLEEIQQLRNESRKLRDANHRLDEENRQLKDILWDFKRQREWISTKRFKGKMENVEITKRGDGAISAQKLELHKKEQETAPQKKSPLPSQLQCVSTSSQLRFEYFNIKEKNGPTKASEGVNNMTFDQRLQSWDDEDKDRASSSASPISVDSDCTEALIASCNNGTFGQASNSKEHHLEDIQTKQSTESSNDAMSDVITDILLTPARLQMLSKPKEKPIVMAEEKERSFSRNVIKGSLLDLDGLSDDDMSSKSQINGRHQFPYTHCSSSTPCKSVPSFPGFWSSCLNRNDPMRSIVNKAVLPRRPFAPRSITDLKIGHLVKFSRPAGKISKGVIKYVGLLPGRQEAYLGIELEGNEVGQHDGTFEGVRYFICKLNKGVFVNFSKVIMAWE